MPRCEGAKLQATRSNLAIAAIKCTCTIEHLHAGECNGVGGKWSLLLLRMSKVRSPYKLMAETVQLFSHSSGAHDRKSV